MHRFAQYSKGLVLFEGNMKKYLGASADLTDLNLTNYVGVWNLT